MSAKNENEEIKYRKYWLKEIKTNLLFQQEHTYFPDGRRLSYRIYEICVGVGIKVSELFCTPVEPKHFQESIFRTNDIKPVWGYYKRSYWNNLLNVYELSINNYNITKLRNMCGFIVAEIRRAYIKKQMTRRDLRIIIKVLKERLPFRIDFRYESYFIDMLYDNPEKCHRCKELLHTQNNFPPGFPDNWKFCCNCHNQYLLFLEIENGKRANTTLGFLRTNRKSFKGMVLEWK